MTIRKRGLGRGLDALLGAIPGEIAEAGTGDLSELPVDRSPQAYQPRQDFEEGLNEPRRRCAVGS
jgi:hypothetical protein